ncbi:MAG: 5'/3'-nucleotidase SurE [Deltaproteobacteria bacterium]|uniref:5'-nucleotidase SurE n=1 Tax=Candidatus Zymogenus saltonus TaxID=2844893 RepID=A0A9D8KJR5_9DELT|nr:5'/3'-nucleotidase SurE [Candidatus Zymogenus saltonus]
MNILISNDDGIDAPGIKKLAEKLEEDHEIFIVAPTDEKSASSHSLTLKRPLTVRQRSNNYFAVDGTPADCVNLAVNSILKRRPDLVLSGINHGANLGEDIFYSGTVSAAMEGLLLGVPSIAFSFEMRNSSDFAPAAEFASRLIKYVQKWGLMRDTVLNVNVPDRIIERETIYMITKQGRRIYSGAVEERTDFSGVKFYTIGSKEIKVEEDLDSDFFAVNSGYVSITPLHLDLTNYSSIMELKDWKV